MMKKTIYLLSLLLVLGGCKKDGQFETDVEEFFHVEVNGVLLPVKVRGNTHSRKIILFVNGGPGGTGLDVSVLDPGEWQNNLENDFAIAYYDQRGIGNAQGRYDESTMTLDQYVDDIDGIIRVLHYRYENSQVYLMGHSFGALLAYKYIRTYGHEGRVEKYIAAAGLGSRIKDDVHWAVRREYLETVASQFVDEGRDPGYWQNVLDWLAGHPVMDTQELRAQMFSYMEQTQIEEEISIDVSDVFNILLFSDNNFFPYYLTLKKRQTVLNMLIDDERQWDVNADIPLLDQPLLLIGGEFDINVPPQELQWIYNTIASDEKEIVILPDAGHDHYISQPDMFYKAVKQFIE